MKGQIGFVQGVIVAFALTLFGTVAMSLSVGLTMTTALLSGAYLMYLLVNSERANGRVTALTLWLVGSLVIGWINPSPLAFLSYQAVTLWLVRSWCFLRTPLQAIADLGLWVAAGAVGASTLLHTHSIPLTLWSALLILALWPVVAQFCLRWTTQPAAQDISIAESPPPSSEELAAQKFAQAKDAAQHALRALATSQHQ